MLGNQYPTESCPRPDFRRRVWYTARTPRGMRTSGTALQINASFNVCLAMVGSHEGQTRRVDAVDRLRPGPAQSPPPHTHLRISCDLTRTSDRCIGECSILFTRLLALTPRPRVKLIMAVLRFAAFGATLSLAAAESLYQSTAYDSGSLGTAPTQSFFSTSLTPPLVSAKSSGQLAPR